MNIPISFISILALFIPIAAVSAPTETVASYVWTLNSPPSRDSINNAYSGVADGIAWVVNLKVENAIRDRVKRIFDNYVAKQADILKWSNSGMLLKI